MGLCGANLYAFRVNRNIPTLEVDAKNKEACGITLDDITDLDDVTILHCRNGKNHYFDTTSIEKWFFDKKKECPVCRDIDPKRTRYWSIEKIQTELESKNKAAEVAPQIAKELEAQNKAAENAPAIADIKRFRAVGEYIHPALQCIVSSMVFRAVAAPLNLVHWVCYLGAIVLSEVAKKTAAVFAVTLACAGGILTVPWFVIVGPILAIAKLTNDLFFGFNFDGEALCTGLSLPAVLGSIPIKKISVINEKIDWVANHTRPLHTPWSICKHSFLLKPLP